MPALVQAKSGGYTSGPQLTRICLSHRRYMCNEGVGEARCNEGVGEGAYMPRLTYMCNEAA